MNKTILIGRLTKHVEVRQAGNTSVARFILTVNKQLSKEKRQEYESQGKNIADFIPIEAWGKMGVNASKYLSKGSQCAIEGRIETGSYIDKNTGKTIYTTVVVAENIEFLESVKNSNQNVNYNNNQQNNNQTNNNYYNQNNNYNNNGADYNQYNAPVDDGLYSDDFFDDDFTEIEDDPRMPF